MRHVFAVAGMLAASIAAAGTTAPAKQAPTITSSRWFNSAPLTTADLKDKVRLVEF